MKSNTGILHEPTLEWAAEENQKNRQPGASGEPNWNLIEAVASIGITHYDGCHRLLIAVDETAHKQLIDAGRPRVSEQQHDGDAIKHHWKTSCEMRVIYAVRSDHAGILEYLRLTPPQH